MAAVERWVILTLEETTRLEFDEKLGSREVVIPAGSFLYGVLWNGETEWVPPEGTRVMREADYLAKETADAEGA